MFAIALTLSSFLLFLVQPLIAKVILPWFGGSPSLWTVCMLFFQSALLGGYAYAHVLVTRVPLRLQPAIHIMFAILAVLLLPPVPGSEWKPIGAVEPTGEVLRLLFSVVGLPYFVLAASAPLLQSWFAKANPGKSPYRLYSLSNASSLAALLAFPLLLEPRFSIRVQGWAWSVGFLLYLITLLLCGRNLKSVSNSETQAASKATSDPTSLIQYAWWFALPFVASVLLLSVTNELCQDIAVIPFLWVLPLSLYLLSFIICFDHERWYWRGVWIPFSMLGIGLILGTTFGGAEASLWEDVTYWSLALFSLCMVCHGELVRMKPAADRLTGFYLVVSFAGACGGLFVALGAPAVFSTFYELPLSILLCALLIATLLSRSVRFTAGLASVSRLAPAALATCYLMLGAYVAYQMYWQLQPDETLLAEKRNFYGVIRVMESAGDDETPATRSMYHGRIVHGLQFLDPARSRRATTYYSPESGLGMVFNLTSPGRRVAAIGLGTGSVAAYAKAGDQFRFFEINPLMRDLSAEYFTFVSGSPAPVDVILGDARVSLEREGSEQFDIVILDAFSGDAIPTHLLTKEAFEMYLQHLAPEGIFAVHISNLYFDLRPVLRGIQETFGLKAVHIASPDDEAQEIYGADWILMGRSNSLLGQRAFRETRSEDFTEVRPIYWTDDFTSLVPLLVSEDDV